MINKLSRAYYYLSLLAITATSCSVYTMEQKMQLKLSPIEQQLLSREINKRGKDLLLKKISKKREIKFIYHQNKKQNGIKRPIVLEIDDTFYKGNAETDPLTKNIFDTIEKRQKEYEKHIASAPFTKQPPTTKLGKRTHYCWLEENNNTAVKIQSRFQYVPYDQRALTAFIENYQQ